MGGGRGGAPRRGAGLRRPASHRLVDQIGAAPERGPRLIRLIVDGVKLRNVPAFLSG